MTIINFENLKEEEGIDLINFYSNMVIEHKQEAYNMLPVRKVFQEITRRFKVCKICIDMHVQISELEK